jgi:hypothetical protein
MQAWNQWNNQAAASGFAMAGYPPTAAVPPPTAAAAPQTAYSVGYQYYGAGPGLSSATPVSSLL